MKFKINQNLLMSTLNIVNRGLSTKTPMPILTGILMEVEPDKIIFTTTNKEVSIQVVVDQTENIKIEDTGSCVIPGKYFVEIIKKLEEQEITISLFDETTVKIITERSQFTLNALDKMNFPKINFNIASDPIKLESGLLKKIISQTSFAASVTESRLVLTGVKFDVKEDTLSVTATDSFRLAKRVTTLNEKYQSQEMLIPSKALDELFKIIEDRNSEISIYVASNKVLVKYQNISFMTRLIEGRYPDTNSLVSAPYDLEVKFNKNELLSAIERASLLSSASDSLNITRMTMKQDKTVKILSNSTEIGNVEEDLYPVFINQASQFQVAFSAKHFIDAIKVLDSNTITIHFNGEIKPFTIIGDNDPELVQVILPLRVYS